MSTLKTINIIHPTGSTNNMVSDAGGNVTVGNNLTVTGNETVSGNLTVTGNFIPSSSYRRNHIINGNMRIAQRGTSFTNVANGSLVNHYTLDRWYAYRNTYTSNLSVSQQAGFGGAQYCLRHQRAAGDTSTTSMLLAQIIESANMVDLQGQTVTLSFWARTGANYSGGNLTIGLKTGTTADQGAATFIAGWAGTDYPIYRSSQAFTSTATRYTFTGTVLSNALEMGLFFIWTPTGTAGAADYIEITNVQVEIGSAATPYEYQKVSEQLAECQRYYETFNVAVGSWYNGSGGAVNAGSYVPFKVTMRTAPSSIGFTNVSATNTSADAGANISADGFAYGVTISATGNYSRVSTITATAEL